MYANVICNLCEPNRIFTYLKHELRKSFVKFSDKTECFLNEVCVKLLPNFVREGKMWPAVGNSTIFGKY